MNMERAKWYSKQIMVSLERSEKYHKFLTALRDFRDQKINDADAVSCLKESLTDHRDLLRGLSFFLETSVWTSTRTDHSLQRKQFSDPAADKSINKASSSQPVTLEADTKGSPKGRFSDDEVSQIHQVTEFVNKVRERLNDDNGAYKYFLDVIGRYKDGGGSSKVGEKIIKPLFKNCPDLYIEFIRLEADCYTTVGTKRLLEFKDRCEEVMFKCEDVQIEVDVQLNCLESAILSMTEFLEVVKETDMQIDINGYFTPMVLRCIEQLYGWKDEDDDDHSPGLIDLLCACPVDASTTILDRLIQKFKEAEELHHKVNSVSVKVYKDCHEKRGKNCR